MKQLVRNKWRWTGMGVFLLALLLVVLFRRGGPNAAEQWKDTMRKKGEVFSLEKLAPKPSKEAGEYVKRLVAAARALPQSPVPLSLVKAMQTNASGRRIVACYGQMLISAEEHN